MRADEQGAADLPNAAAARAGAAEGHEGSGRESWVVYFAVGVALGVIFIKSEVASWFRIQEMFRFQAVHMYGVIGTAVLVGALGVATVKRLGGRTVRGEAIAFPDAEERKARPRHALGGTVFGLGWGLVGACPGPMYALVGGGSAAIAVALASAVAGAWVYGFLRPHLPH